MTDISSGVGKTSKQPQKKILGFLGAVKTVMQVIGWATLNAMEASLKGGTLAEIRQKQVNMHAKAIICLFFSSGPRVYIILILGKQKSQPDCKLLAKKQMRARCGGAHL